jgi:hypothetical protein
MGFRIKFICPIEHYFSRWVQLWRQLIHPMGFNLLPRRSRLWTQSVRPDLDERSKLFSMELKHLSVWIRLELIIAIELHFILEFSLVHDCQAE